MKFELSEVLALIFGVMLIFLVVAIIINATPEKSKYLVYREGNYTIVERVEE